MDKDNQIRALSEQLERFEKHQRQMQLEASLEQRRHLQQKLAQSVPVARNAATKPITAQVVRNQLGQMQQPGVPSGTAMTDLEASSNTSGSIVIKFKIMETAALGRFAVHDRRNTEPLANSTENQFRSNPIKSWTKGIREKRSSFIHAKDRKTSIVFKRVQCHRYVQQFSRDVIHRDKPAPEFAGYV